MAAQRRAARTPRVPRDPPGVEIDARVLGLVAAMNSLPGVSTFSSCGGHPDWRTRSLSALPPDQFNVNFDVAPTAAGWRSLDLLAWAVCNLQDAAGRCKHVRLTAWTNGEPGELHDPAEPAVCFELAGGHGADPNRLATLIAAAAAEWRQKAARRAPRDTRAHRKRSPG